MPFNSLASNTLARPLGAPLGMGRRESGLPSLIIDFSALPDGQYAGTWSVSGGKLINTPGMGAEILPDPTWEGTYTAGKNANINVQSGSPVLAESVDAHGGSKAQSFTGSAIGSQIQYQYNAGTTFTDKWFHFETWHKASAADSTVGMMFGAQRMWLRSTTWARVVMDRPAEAQYYDAVFARERVGSVLRTVLLDDSSFKLFTFADLIYLYPTPRQPNDIVTVRCSAMLDGSAWGIAYNWDQTKQNGIIVNVSYGDSVVRLHIEKWLSGHRTEVKGVAFTFVADADLSVYRNGDVLYVDYNNELLTTATISDAAIANNPYHGIFSTNAANQIGNLKIQPFVNPNRIFAFGDSRTVGAADTPPTAGYSKILADSLGWKLARYATSGWKCADLKTYIDNNPIPTNTGNGWAIIYIGVNDTAPSLPDETTFKANYTAIIDAIHTALPNYLIGCALIGAAGEDADSDTIDQRITEVVATRSTAFVGPDDRVLFKGANNYATYSSDGWHWNHAGNVLLADAWMTALSTANGH
jgi:lysophospholipase L1-like esterase